METRNNQVNREPMTPEELSAWVAQKQEQRDTVYALIESQTKHVFSDPKNLNDHLKRQATFGKMGVSNVLLVGAQKPDATEIRSFDDWSKRKRSVKKGEKAIAILEAKGEYTQEDGTTRQNFDVKSVFDVSQTYGKDQRQWQPAPAKSVINALLKKIPIEIVASNTTESARFDKDSLQMEVNRNQRPEQMLYTVAREFGVSEGLDPFEAKCAASVVCYRYGVTPDAIDKIPNEVVGMEHKELKSLLGRVRDCAATVCDHIDHNLQQERQRKQEER